MIVVIGATGFVVEQRYAKQQADSVASLDAALASADVSGSGGAETTVSHAEPGTAHTESTSGSSSSSESAGGSATEPTTGTESTPPSQVSVEPAPITEAPKLFPVLGTFMQTSSTSTSSTTDAHTTTSTPIANHTVKVFQVIKPACSEGATCSNAVGLTLYTSTTTDAQGKFSFNAPVGNYELQLSPNVCTQSQAWFFTETGQYDLTLALTANCSATTQK